LARRPDPHSSPHALPIFARLVLSLLREGVAIRALAREHAAGAAGHGRGRESRDRRPAAAPLGSGLARHLGSQVRRGSATVHDGWGGHRRPVPVPPQGSTASPDLWTVAAP